MSAIIAYFLSCLTVYHCYWVLLLNQVSEETSEEAAILASLREELPSRPGLLPPAIVFIGVRGTNCQAADSPSWFNPHEAVEVAKCLQAFYSVGLSPEQCGIITPYQAQVLAAISLSLIRYNNLNIYLKPISIVRFHCLWICVIVILTKFVNNHSKHRSKLNGT